MKLKVKWTPDLRYEIEHIYSNPDDPHYDEEIAKNKDKIIELMIQDGLISEENKGE